MNKGISAASKFNQSKYENMLKKHGSEFGKIAGKKILTKSADVAGDLIGSKIANKITSGNALDSLKVKDKPQVIEEQEENNYSTRKKTANFN